MDQPIAKAALVTGAGSGIGRAISLALGRGGYRVLLVGRRHEPLEETKRLMPPGLGVVAPADVTQEAACRGVVRQAIVQFGRLDVLVNNAGTARVVPIGDSDGGVIDEAFRTNTFPVAWAIHEAWSPMAAQGGGCIINISSIATTDPFPGFFAYAASKASLNLMATSAAKEGEPHRIRAFSIAPGAVETPLLRSAFDPSQIPPENTLAPDDVARVVMDCVQGRRDRDNGRTIPVVPESSRAWLEDWIRTHPALTK